eukprot:CAMPEP_0169458604 /NCGR_PEP_ID=MMETSP1042-20121227/17522_1 /TAXON_ID=464988 /ORGANISM="Hemiselmis andersenii, Strain CCMP1180" /LENGTH=109 /DNA_ID=CAMNT_0009570999 /DNA_START=102 /DNA_END=428 /DNA_ORIENTATION=-
MPSRESHAVGLYVQEEKAIHDIVQKAAAKKCDPIIKAFVDCSKANGLMVVFNCRKQNEAMQQCMHEETTEEKYEAVRVQRQAEMRASKEAEIAAKKAAEEAEKKKKSSW